MFGWQRTVAQCGREVRLVKRLAGAILVDGDLTENEAVVMEGVQGVRAGAPLKILSAATLDAGMQAASSSTRRHQWLKKAFSLPGDCPR